ncbi:hypothetical protein [uncultured Ruegeria sp.]|uniref:hypothetical protein n=1 Tax=uncultured Ruegeria sp. TaxID=259304 RepID=UPI00261F0EDC|nr:hypothetical protein [uncultured Ruegeria sp.]
MDDWLTAYRDWWKCRVSKHPMLWLLCLFLAVFVLPTLAWWIWESDSAAVVIAFLVSALLFLPGILIAGLEFLLTGSFFLRDRIQREKTQGLINRRNCSFWKWW